MKAMTLAEVLKEESICRSVEDWMNCPRCLAYEKLNTGIKNCKQAELEG